jgi:hypothetical protein
VPIREGAPGKIDSLLVNETHKVELVVVLVCFGTRV